jgi:aryl-alcohol dehydrogenase-like predicted oxidoreductase/enamine deaminase RidA (YjgF/YER057c/UK114 family)
VPAPGPVSRELVRAAVERSLARMGGPAIDLLQFHAWNYADPAWLDALIHLQELKGEGLIRHLGVTNFDTAHLRIAVESGIEILTNQVSFSLIDRRAAGALSTYCLARGVRLLAYGTVAGGWLTDRWIGLPEPDWERAGTWSEMKYGRFLNQAGGWPALQRLLSGIAEIAERHQVSVTNVATRWVLDHLAVAGVIIGARLGQRQHRDDNSRLFDVRLTDADRAAITTAQETLLPIPGDTGDEYRKPPFLTASGDLSHHIDQVPAAYPTRPGPAGKTLCLSGTTWEDAAGFARAVRTGNRILVSGTTATHGTRTIGGQDPAAQTHAAIDKIEGALQSLGGRLDQVVRTRIYIKNLADWEAVARAHGERFGPIRPANTLVRADLVGEDYLVEVEAEACLP